LTSLNPVFKIGDQIAEAIAIHREYPPEELTRRIIALLSDVGISSPQERINAYPHQLSGGQRQRVMIAMALACDPQLVIADEPTTALDVTVQAQILRLLKRLQQQRAMSVLYITHDLGVVASIADYIYVMYAGIIVEQGRPEHIFYTAQHPYTQGLLAALPTRRKKGTQLYSIPGSVPDPAYKPEGCPFHPRCPHVEPDCRRQEPAMCDYGKGHRARCPVLYARHKTGGFESTA
jgi:peptide/nickel transport system ATP-binding protein/oligopeptide transport system ATP-binding protein